MCGSKTTELPLGIKLKKGSVFGTVSGKGKYIYIYSQHCLFYKTMSNIIQLKSKRNPKQNSVCTYSTLLLPLMNLFGTWQDV